MSDGNDGLACECGCGGLPRVRRGRPQRFINGHNGRRHLMDRFCEKVEKTPTCWLWTGAAQSAGYGITSQSGVPIGAHRAAYAMFVGPIPEGLTIDHLCRNPRCVNPDHLEAVTMGVNVLRGDSPSSLNARKTHCKRGHEFTEENTYTQARHRHCRACRREQEQIRRSSLHGVSP